MLTRLSEQVFTSGHLHQLRHPVSAGHQRIDPLDRGDARPIARRRAHLGDGLHARPQLSHDALALAFAPERECHLPISCQMSASLSGLSDTILAALPDQSHRASSTSLRLTAQASQ